MRSIRFALALAGVAASALPAAASALQVQRGAVTVVCPMTIGGSFDAKTTAVEGQVTAAGAGLDGAFHVDLATLDTGIDLRNRHLRENYLEVAKGEGFARATLTGVKVEGADLATFAGKGAFTGTFTVHGQSRPVSGTAEVRRSGGQVEVVATFPVNVPDFGIAKPRHLGVGVKDEVKVKVELVLAPAAAAAAPSGS